MCWRERSVEVGRYVDNITLDGHVYINDIDVTGRPRSVDNEPYLLRPRYMDTRVPNGSVHDVLTSVVHMQQP